MRYLIDRVGQAKEDLSGNLDVLALNMYIMFIYA